MSDKYYIISPLPEIDYNFVDVGPRPQLKDVRGTNRILRRFSSLDQYKVSPLESDNYSNHGLYVPSSPDLNFDIYNENLNFISAKPPLSEYHNFGSEHKGLSSEESQKVLNYGNNFHTFRYEDYSLRNISYENPSSFSSWFSSSGALGINEYFAHFGDDYLIVKLSEDEAIVPPSLNISSEFKDQQYSNFFEVSLSDIDWGSISYAERFSSYFSRSWFDKFFTGPYSDDQGEFDILSKSISDCTDPQDCKLKFHIIGSIDNLDDYKQWTESNVSKSDGLSLGNDYRWQEANIPSVQSALVRSTPSQSSTSPKVASLYRGNASYSPEDCPTKWELAEDYDWVCQDTEIEYDNPCPVTPTPFTPTPESVSLADVDGEIISVPGKIALERGDGSTFFVNVYEDPIPEEEAIKDHDFIYTLLSDYVSFNNTLYIANTDYSEKCESTLPRGEFGITLDDRNSQKKLLVWLEENSNSGDFKTVLNLYEMKALFLNSAYANYNIDHKNWKEAKGSYPYWTDFRGHKMEATQANEPRMPRYLRDIKRFFDFWLNGEESEYHLKPLSYSRNREREWENNTEKRADGLFYWKTDYKLEMGFKDSSGYRGYTDYQWRLSRARTDGFIIRDKLPVSEERLDKSTHNPTWLRNLSYLNRLRTLSHEDINSNKKYLTIYKRATFNRDSTKTRYNDLDHAQVDEADAISLGDPCPPASTPTPEPTPTLTPYTPTPGVIEPLSQREDMLSLASVTEYSVQVIKEDGTLWMSSSTQNRLTTFTTPKLEYNPPYSTTNPYGEVRDTFWEQIDTNVEQVHSGEFGTLYVKSNPNEHGGYDSNIYWIEKIDHSINPATGVGTVTHGVELLFEAGALKVVDFSVGYDHALFVLDNGSLWGFGSNENGQLGKPADFLSASEPVNIVPAPASTFFNSEGQSQENQQPWGVRLCAAGKKRSAFVKSDLKHSIDRLLGMGHSDHTLQLGKDFGGSSYSPKEIAPVEKLLSEDHGQITSLSLGYEHIAYSTSSGRVYAAGDCRFGQSGIPAEHYIGNPWHGWELVNSHEHNPFLAGVVFTKVIASGDHTHFISLDKGYNIYFCGKSDNTIKVRAYNPNWSSELIEKLSKTNNCSSSTGHIFTEAGDDASKITSSPELVLQRRVPMDYDYKYYNAPIFNPPIPLDSNFQLICSPKNTIVVDIDSGDVFTTGNSSGQFLISYTDKHYLDSYHYNDNFSGSSCLTNRRISHAKNSTDHVEIASVIKEEIDDNKGVFLGEIHGQGAVYKFITDKLEFFNVDFLFKEIGQYMQPLIDDYQSINFGQSDSSRKTSIAACKLITTPIGGYSEQCCGPDFLLPENPYGGPPITPTPFPGEGNTDNWYAPWVVGETNYTHLRNGKLLVDLVEEATRLGVKIICMDVDRDRGYDRDGDGKIDEEGSVIYNPKGENTNAHWAENIYKEISPDSRFIVHGGNAHFMDESNGGSGGRFYSLSYASVRTILAQLMGKSRRFLSFRFGKLDSRPVGDPSAACKEDSVGVECWGCNPSDDPTLYLDKWTGYLINVPNWVDQLNNFPPDAAREDQNAGAIDSGLGPWEGNPCISMIANETLYPSIDRIYSSDFTIQGCDYVIMLNNCAKEEGIPDVLTGLPKSSKYLSYDCSLTESDVDISFCAQPTPTLTPTPTTTTEFTASTDPTYIINHIKDSLEEGLFFGDSYGNISQTRWIGDNISSLETNRLFIEFINSDHQSLIDSYKDPDVLVNGSRKNTPEHCALFDYLSKMLSKDAHNIDYFNNCPNYKSTDDLCIEYISVIDACFESNVKVIAIGYPNNTNEPLPADQSTINLHFFDVIRNHLNSYPGVKFIVWAGYDHGQRVGFKDPDVNQVQFRSYVFDELNEGEGKKQNHPSIDYLLRSDGKKITSYDWRPPGYVSSDSNLLISDVADDDGSSPWFSGVYHGYPNKYSTGLGPYESGPCMILSSPKDLREYQDDDQKWYADFNIFTNGCSQDGASFVNYDCTLWNTVDHDVPNASYPPAHPPECRTCDIYLSYLSCVDGQYYFSCAPEITLAEPPAERLSGSNWPPEDPFDPRMSGDHGLMVASFFAPQENLDAELLKNLEFIYEYGNEIGNASLWFARNDKNVENHGVVISAENIALQILYELEHYDALDWAQETASVVTISPTQSYGPAQFKPETLAMLINEEYYPQVPGFKDDLNDEQELQHLFDEIMKPRNAPMMVAAYFQRILDIWAKGTPSDHVLSPGKNPAPKLFNLQENNRGAMLSLYILGNKEAHDSPQLSPSYLWDFEKINLRLAEIRRVIGPYGFINQFISTSPPDTSSASMCARFIGASFDPFKPSGVYIPSAHKDSGECNIPCQETPTITLSPTVTVTPSPTVTVTPSPTVTPTVFTPTVTPTEIVLNIEYEVKIWATNGYHWNTVHVTHGPDSFPHLLNLTSSGNSSACSDLGSGNSMLIENWVRNFQVTNIPTSLSFIFDQTGSTCTYSVEITPN